MPMACCMNIHFLVSSFLDRFTVGEAFFQVSEEEAMESLEKAKSLTQEALKKGIEEHEKVRSEMDVLKKTLYAKFGSNINLEDK